MPATRFAFLAVVGSLLVGAAIWTFAGNPASQLQSQTQQPKPRIGLMTSLPIYWREAAALEDMLSDDEGTHWVREQIEEDYELVPLDALADTATTAPNGQFAALDRLILAQPYALPPADLVALDEWVRAGGKLLLFVDPMLTEQSEFGFGDKRRPQDIAMLDPILARWGLALVYDEAQPDGPHTVSLGPLEIPVHKSGKLELAESSDLGCEQVANGLIAQCTIERGQAVIVSDAALLEKDVMSPGSKKALNSLLVRTFGGK